MFAALCRTVLRLLFAAAAIIVVGVAIAGDGRGALERLSAAAWDGQGGDFSVKGLASAVSAELRRTKESLTWNHAEPRFQIEVARPLTPRGLACEFITPGAVDLRAQTPPGWSDHELRRARWRASLTRSKGGEEPAAGFVEGKCVVGVRARGDALSPELAWDSVRCQQQCLADSACLGVMWGRVQTQQDGANYRCFLTGTGNTDDIIGYPCKSSFWCPRNVSYTALSSLAPTMQCWQRRLWNCPVSQEDAVNVALDTAYKTGHSCRATGVQLLDKLQDSVPWDQLQDVLPQDPESKYRVKVAATAISALLLLWTLRCLTRAGQDRQFRTEAAAAAIAAGAAAGPISMSSASAPVAISAGKRQLSAEDAALFGSWSEAPPPSPAVHTRRRVPSPVRSATREEPRSPFWRGLGRSAVPPSPSPAKVALFQQPPQSPVGTNMLSMPSTSSASSSTLGSVPEVHEFVAPPSTPAVVTNRRQSVAAATPAAELAPQELMLVAILNDGGLDDLKALKGLGQVSAKKILDYRKTGQQIHRLEDLVKHVGLTKATLQRVSQNS